MILVVKYVCLLVFRLKKWWYRVGEGEGKKGVDGVEGGTLRGK